MKTLIQNYKFPRVSNMLLEKIMIGQKKKNIIFVLLQFIVWAAIFMLFIKNLTLLNVQYYSFFSSLGNIGIFLQLLLQVIIGVIHFVIYNSYLIFSLLLISFISNVYSIVD